MTHNWENIEVGVKEIGYDCMDWIHLAQDRAKLRAVLNLSTKFWEFIQWRTNIGF
jgi:hypothetical protein